MYCVCFLQCRFQHNFSPRTNLDMTETHKNKCMDPKARDRLIWICVLNHIHPCVSCDQLITNKKHTGIIRSCSSLQWVGHLLVFLLCLISCRIKQAQSYGNIFLETFGAREQHWNRPQTSFYYIFQLRDNFSHIRLPPKSIQICWAFGWSQTKGPTLWSSSVTVVLHCVTLPFTCQLRAPGWEALDKGSWLKMHEPSFCWAGMTRGPSRAALEFGREVERVKRNLREFRDTSAGSLQKVHYIVPTTELHCIIQPCVRFLVGWL